jgi:PAS domain S-box-containing protein
MGVIRLLLVEDVEHDAQLALRELRRAGIALEYRIVDREEAFLRELEAFAPHMILSDFSMPHFDGMAALALARERAPNTPFLFISGSIGEEYAIRALSNGASDYVLKGNLMRLPPAVERALARAQEKAARSEAERALAGERQTNASILAALPDAVWSADCATDRVLYVSPKTSEIYGSAASEFLERSDRWIDAIHPEDKPAVRDAWKRFRSGGKFDQEYRIVRPDGAVRWINDRAHLVRDASGEPARIDRLARDVTSQVEHRERVARLSRIRELIGSINAALIRVRERDALFRELCRIAVLVGGFAKRADRARPGISGRARLGRIGWYDIAVFGTRRAGRPSGAPVRRAAAAHGRACSVERYQGRVGRTRQVAALCRRCALGRNVPSPRRRAAPSACSCSIRASRASSTTTKCACFAKSRPTSGSRWS